MNLFKRYVLRSKVRIRDVSEEWDVWATWGSEGVKETREWNWARSGAVEPVWRTSEWPWGTENGIILDRRAPGMGKRMLVRKGDTREPVFGVSYIELKLRFVAADASTHDLAGKDAYLLHRIMHGVPEGSVDIQPMHAFPIESNLDAMGGRMFLFCFI
jgi:folate-binding Fe-S cluster repair protein YgfZ